MPQPASRLCPALSRPQLAGYDWQAAVVGNLVRSISLVKSVDPLGHRNRLEHSLFVVLSLAIIIGSLQRSPLYLRARNLAGLLLRLGPLLGAAYVYDDALLHPSAEEHAADCVTFFLKLALACRAVPLALTSLMLPLPLWAVAALQPASLALLARRNGGVCAAAAAHPHAAEWLRNATGLLGAASSVVPPGVRPAPGAECAALALWLQLSLGGLLPVLYLVKGEAQRFADYCAAHQDAVCHAPVAKLYRSLHAWANGAELATARHATVLAALAGSWILIALWYS